MIDWKNIRSVFLDMDGTLLDLHFDNHFWREHVPLRYAEGRGLSLEAAKAACATLASRIRWEDPQVEGELFGTQLDGAPAPWTEKGRKAAQSKESKLFDPSLPHFDAVERASKAEPAPRRLARKPYRARIFRKEKPTPPSAKGGCCAR